MALDVALVSPERILFTGQADMVVCRTLGGGDIAFLTGHAPLVGALDIHQVRILLADGSQVTAAVHGGFVEVRGDKVSILSDVAELQGEIDVDRAGRALAEAERQRSVAADIAVEAALRRAHLRLLVAGQMVS